MCNSSSRGSAANSAVAAKGQQSTFHGHRFLLFLFLFPDLIMLRLFLFLLFVVLGVCVWFSLVMECHSLLLLVFLLL